MGRPLRLQPDDSHVRPGDTDADAARVPRAGPRPHPGPAARPGATRARKA